MGERGPTRVLLVEDDPGDVLMTREAFGERGKLLTVVSDGEEALAYVRREGRFHGPTVRTWWCST